MELRRHEARGEPEVIRRGRVLGGGQQGGVVWVALYPHGEGVTSLGLITLVGEANRKSHPGRAVTGIQTQTLPQRGDSCGVLLILCLGLS